MQSHQQARQYGRKRKFHDHDSIDGRCGEHDHCAQCRLYQTQSNYAEPADRVVHDAADTSDRSAKALTNIPET